MSLPPIAPLTRKEARAARMFQADVDRLVAGIDPTQPGADALAFMQRAMGHLDDALAEYARRPWWHLTPPGGHRIRLRTWMLEMRALALRERDLL